MNVMLGRICYGMCNVREDVVDDVGGFGMSRIGLVG